ncbi:MAG: hypothetical protein PHT89_09615 [Lachnospiraceae bacterium]|nr:hypothetical protein [Lachnospiraceae bacterium]
MLSLLLTILKIIGTLLLILILTIIVLLVIVLFVPIRYEIRSTKKNNIIAFAKIHWLLHIVRAEVTYHDSLQYTVKVFWFRLLNSSDETSAKNNKNQKKKSKRDSKQNRKASKNPKNADKNGDNIKRINSINNINSEINTDINEKINTDINENIKKDLENKNISSNKTSKEKTDYIESNQEERNANKAGIRNPFLKLKQKCSDVIYKIRYTFKSICDKIKKVTEDAAYWKRMTEDPKCKAALKEAWKQLIHVLKSIRPRKLQAEIVLGTQDPGTLGNIMAWYGMFYPFYSYHIQLYPEFDRVIFEYDAYLKGRIRIFTILFAGVRLYFNKDIKYVIALFNREEK